MRIFLKICLWREIESSSIAIAWGNIKQMWFYSNTAMSSLFSLCYRYIYSLCFPCLGKLNPGLISIFELKLELKRVGPLVTRGGLETSYFCVTDQSMAALVWLRAAMLLSVPGVEIHLHTSHSILLLPVLYWRRRTEWAPQSMTGRGHHILTSRVTL